MFSQLFLCLIGEVSTVVIVISLYWSSGIDCFHDYVHYVQDLDADVSVSLQGTIFRASNFFAGIIALDWGQGGASYNCLIVGTWACLLNVIQCSVAPSSQNLWWRPLPIGTGAKFYTSHTFWWFDCLVEDWRSGAGAKSSGLFDFCLILLVFKHFKSWALFGGTLQNNGLDNSVILLSRELSKPSSG